MKNAYANNMDLRYEFYPAPGETVTIGGFYKRFDNPIEQTYMEAGSGLQYTYHNADHANAFGVELDIKKNLDFIGLKGLSFVFNGVISIVGCISPRALSSGIVRCRGNPLT